jgi:hypothetical protein
MAPLATFPYTGTYLDPLAAVEEGILGVVG